jgi:3-methyladenine DNA glycosylase AlkD
MPDHARPSSVSGYRVAVEDGSTAIAEGLADRLEAELQRLGDPERAAGERRYLKSDLNFHGVTLPEIERAVRALTVAAPLGGHDDLVALVEALWAQPVHERRMAAVLLLERHRQVLGVGDLPLLERLVRESRTWAYVDALAANVVGPLCTGVAGAGDVLDRWAADADFWVRRAALLSQLRPLRDGAPLDRFARYADAMLGEREFFIRKAIGWVLREAGKQRPADVIAWLADRTDRASGVTMREAVKYLPEADAARLMAAYRARRRAT